MKIFKVGLIVLLSILGAAGIIVLGIYLSGGFEAKYIYPQDIFFANVAIVDDEPVYTERGSTPYNKYENFKLIISTKTEDFNQDEITLSFPSNQTGSIVRYLQKVDLYETFANDSVVVYYAKDNEGKLIKFASCGQSQASFITNGNIIVPIKVKINKEFDVLVCLAPDNMSEAVEISEDGVILTQLYNIGGFSQLIARSANLNASSTSAYINIDVPVEKIEIVGITGENISDTNVLGLNEGLLKDTDLNGYCEIGTDGLFSVVLAITPARAVYKYGRNGEVGAVQYKTVVFSINSDEGLIAFASNDGNPLTDALSVGGVKYVQNAGISLKDIFGQDFVIENYNFSFNNWAAEFGSIINSVEIKNDILYINIKNNKANDYFDVEITATLKTDSEETITKVVYGYDSSLKYGNGVKTTTLGAKFVAKNNSGQSQIHAGIFRNSILEDEAIAAVGVSNYVGLFNLMNSDFYGIAKTSMFDVKEIAIEGFDVTDKYNQGAGTELDLTINNPTIIYANNPDSGHSLGIEIASNPSAQNKIRNILLSIQFSIDDGETWLDATQANSLLGIAPLFNFYSGNTIVTGEALGIEDDNDLYYFNFFRPLSSANMSYWQVTATSAAEKLADFGIDYIRIYVYYLNPNTGLVLEDEKYGPYEIDTIVNEPIETELGWNSNNNIITNDKIGAGNYNERILIDNNDRILLENLALIKNLSSNPTYKTIRYFVYSHLDDLDEILNVEKYEGMISGISSTGVTIYQVDPSSNYLICGSLKNYKEIEFKLTFAVVEHFPNGSPVIYKDGENNSIYSIITLPTDENDYVTYAPIKIQKTLNIVNIGYDSTGTVSPYGTGDLRSNNTYFLQSTENNIKISFTVDDAELFESLAQKGDIVLSAKYINGLTTCNDVYLYYEKNNQPYNIALEDVLKTIFATNDNGIYINKSDFINIYNILTITPNGNGTYTYKISLSTKDISFAPNENEKEVRVDLIYTLYGNNIPSGYVNPKVLSTNNFFLYSGKILEAYFGTKNNQIIPGNDGLIHVDKTVTGGEFNTTIYINSNTSIILKNNQGYLNVYLQSFGINDLYSISSSDDTIIQLIYNSQTQEYAISFLQSGTATITLIPEYAHTEYEPITLTFDIDSDYDLEDKYWNEIDTNLTTPEIDIPIFDSNSRIKNYDALGYQVVGEKSDNIIYFKNLIQVLARVGVNVADVTNEFVFNVEYDSKIFKFQQLIAPTMSPLSVNGSDNFEEILTFENGVYTFLKKGIFTIKINGKDYIAEVNDVLEATWYTYEDSLIYSETYPAGKIELINDVYGQGIRIKNNFGNDVTLVISAISANLGDTFIFNINIIPFEKIVGEASGHSGAQSPINAEPDSKAVYAASDIIILDFDYKVYDYLNDYTSSLIPDLKYILYDNMGLEIISIYKWEGTNSYSLIQGDIVIATLEFDGEKLTRIIFNDVAEVTKYTLKIQLAGSTNDYDIQKEFIFYVNPNIEVNEDSFENEEAIDSNGIICLNNQNNPIANGEEIGIYIIGSTLKIKFGTKVTINFNRILGETDFEPNALFKIGENEDDYDSAFTVSGVKKLSEQTIVLIYQGKEFTIKYWAAPNISLSEDAKTVIFNGQEYIALYATQNVTNLYTWFKHNGLSNENLLVRFGELASAGSQRNIFTLSKLYTLHNMPNLIEGTTQYIVVKNSYGLIEATIIVANGVGDNAEFVTFKVLIFPMEWSYIKYDSVNENTDIKTIFDGNYVKNVESGNSYQVSTEFISSKIEIQNKFDSYVNSSNSLHSITYNLYLITSSGEVKTANSTSDSVYIGILTSGKLHLITQPLGEDRNYKIEFIYTSTADGVTATYKFNYYVKIIKTQTIEINYPYGASGTELEVDDFVNYQNVYYSQFTNGNYVINLNSSIKNFSENTFVELNIKDTSIEQNSSTASYNKLSYSIYKVFDLTAGNQITTNISNFVTVTSDGIVTLKNFDNKKIGYIVKITTPNGAVGYYKIISDFNNIAKVVTTDNTVDIYYNGSVKQENVARETTITPSDIIIVNGTDVSNIIIGSENVSISKSFKLSSLELAETTNLIKFGLIDSSGKVLNASNSSMMFIFNNGTEQTPDYYVVTKTSANEQRAILVVYTEKDGIIAEIEMVTKSPYSIEYTQSDVWGDSTSVDLTTALEINDTAPPAALNYIIIFNNYKDYINYGLTSVTNINISGKTYIGHQVVSGNASKLQFNSSVGTFSATETGEFVVRVVYNDDVEYYILTSTLSGGTYTVAYKNIAKSSNFEIYPLSSQKTLNITVYIWGTGLSLDGRTDGTTCVKTIDLVVLPNITTNNQSEETTANKTAENSTDFDITDKISSSMFAKIGGADLSTYKYIIEISTTNWGTDEYISFDSVNKTILLKTGDSFSFLSNDLKLYISPVAAIRTAIITVTLYKGNSISEANGDVFVATYTLTITPDTTIDIKYPDHGTGQNFDTEYVYWKDYVDNNKTLNISNNLKFWEITNAPIVAPISVNGLTDSANYANILTFTSASSTYTFKQTGTFIIVVPGDTDKIYKVNVTSKLQDGVTTYIANWYKEEVVNSTYEVQGETGWITISPQKIVTIEDLANKFTSINFKDVVITIKIDGIKRAEYKIRLTNEPVFTAKFDDDKISRDDKIADTAVEEGTKLFKLDFGKLVVQTKGSMLDKPFKLSVVATPKYAGRGIPSLTSVDIYGIGGSIAQVANIYLIKDSMKVGAGLPNLTNISSYDILGRTDDNDIWGIDNNVTYTFNTNGIYYLTMNNGDKYKIDVSGTTTKTATWEKFENNNFVSTSKPIGVYPTSVGTKENFTESSIEFSSILTFTISFNFKQESTEPHAVKFVKNTKIGEEVKVQSFYYFVTVDNDKQPTYYTSTKISLTFKEIFGNNINYDMYDYSISYANSTPEQIQVIHGTEIDQPKALLTYYYNNFQIPYETAKTKFKYDKYKEEVLVSGEENELISGFTVGEFDYANETVVKVKNQFGTEVATYKYKIVYDYAFPESSFDNVTKKANGITSDKNISYYYVESAPNINISGLSILSVEITENEGLSYSNGKFIATGVGTSEVKVSYSDGREKEYSVTTKHEFDSYNNNTEENPSYQVSKLIELNAGQSYDLINDILKTRLELTALNGNPFNSFGFTSIDAINGSYNLIHGSYLSNSQYVTNKTGILGISEKTVTNPQNPSENYEDYYKDFTILPYGAQNGGDIIHLQLTFAGKTYILRIKIVPTISIISTESTGEFVTSFTGNDYDFNKDTTNDSMKYLLSNLVNLNKISSKDLILSVLNDSDTQFVRGPEDNRLIKVGQGETTNDYGLVLYQTQLGGVKIKFKIADKYGYVATDSNGDPITFTLHYQNADGRSPSIYSASASIFEGKNFVIAYRYEEGGVIKYKQYTIGENGVGSWGDELENPPNKANGEALIILDNISGLSPTINLTAKLESLNKIDDVEGILKKATNGSLESLTTNFLPNTRYSGATSISGETFFLTLSLENSETGITETCRIPLNIAVNQRYQLKLKDPYDDFDKIYLRYGVNYALTELFELYDLLESKVYSGGEVTLSYTGIEGQSDTEVGTKYLGLNSSLDKFLWEENPTSYIDKVANGGTQDLAYELQFKDSEGNITQTLSGNTFTINLNITPKYFALDDSFVQKYGDYGVVVKGNETSTNAALSSWGAGYVFKDYYGNVIIEGEESVKLTTASGITFEKADGTNALLASGLISNMTPGGSVLVNVKSDDAIIGTVKVTMSRYYTLLANPSSQTVNTYPIEGNIVLPFDHPTGDGWGEGVLAVVAKTTSLGEAISGGLGSLFQYSISSQSPTGGLAASLEYSETLGCYVINNVEDKNSITITVKYMGIELGTINLARSGTDWLLMS